MEVTQVEELKTTLGRYKTPFFYIQKKILKKNLQKYLEVFPHAKIFYAMKANSESAVLALFDSMGIGFEIASLHELNILKKIKVNSNKIIYGTAVKPHEHIKEAYKYGVKVYAADSTDELQKIASYAPGSQVYIRVVTDDSGSVFRFSEKFGTDTANLIPYLQYAKKIGLVPLGVSFHVGSQASNPSAWANAINSITPLFNSLRKNNLLTNIINIGGGYPCQYASGVVPTLEEIGGKTNDALKEINNDFELWLEPGRGLVASSTVLVVSVIAKVERRGQTWLFLDAGVYNGLFESMSYQGSTRYQVVSMRQIGDGGESLFSLAGPTGDSADVIMKEALLPSESNVGDRLMFLNVGAYSLTVASHFNGFPKPKVYYD